MIKSSALCGSAIIAYLQAKGYPEVRSWLKAIVFLMQQQGPDGFAPSTAASTDR